MGFGGFKKTKTFGEQFRGNIQNFLTPQGLVAPMLNFIDPNFWSFTTPAGKAITFSY